MPEFTSAREKWDNSHSCPLPTLQISKDVCNGLDRTDIHATQRSGTGRKFLEWLCTYRNVSQMQVGGTALFSLQWWIHVPTQTSWALSRRPSKLDPTSCSHYLVSPTSVAHVYSPFLYSSPRVQVPAVSVAFQLAEMAWGGGKTQSRASGRPCTEKRIT